MSISPATFTFLNALLKERSGIHLQQDKEYLLENRLLPIIRQHNIASIDALAQQLQSSPNDALCNEIIEAMTTNETLFFRDTKPFDALRDTILPAVTEHSSGNTIRIWSAACSSGQEPYSLAITLLENPQLLNGKTVEIHASDIDNTILEKAKTGIYSQFEVQRGLPITLLLKYFTQEGEKWQIKDDVKSHITFAQHNLISSNYSILGTFDIIFCRNVLIYFEEETKRTILNNLQSVLAPNGFLFLGSSETTFGIIDTFTAHPDGPPGLFISK